MLIYLIYIQAKRYSDRNTDGRKEVQTFVGVMENVQKAVFIITCRFTKEATLFVEGQSKSIKLIDMELLTDLVVKYQVGINVVQTLDINKVDSNYLLKRRILIFPHSISATIQGIDAETRWLVFCVAMSRVDIS